MEKSYKEYISTNDFEGAKERFESANKRWKDHWFEACEKIFETCKDWAKKYILDKINKAILVIGEFITKRRPKDEEATSNTYLIKMFDEVGNWVFTKIGKANVVTKRMRDFINHEYKRDGVKISNIEIVKTYQVPNDDLAQVLESLMRNYFRKTHKYIPNDRFEAFEPTAEDLQVFENNYNLVMANAQREVEIPLSFCAFCLLTFRLRVMGHHAQNFRFFQLLPIFSTKSCFNTLKY